MTIKNFYPVSIVPALATERSLVPAPRLTVVVALVLAFNMSLARGQQGELEEVLVTGAYASGAPLTASRTVLDNEAIVRLNKRSLAGLLKTVPGIAVEEQGGPGGLTAVSIRGGEANFTLVLLDGVPLNDPTNTRGGSFDFANLNAALVERIEVVRGAQSAIYGSDAVAGVINIITRRPDDNDQLTFSAELGEEGYTDVGAAARGSAGVFDYSLAFASRDEGEPVPGSERDSDSAHASFGWQPNEDHRVSLGLRYLQGERSSYPEQSGGPLLARSDDLDSADNEDVVLSAAWRARFSSRWRSAITLSQLRHDEDFVSPGIEPFFEVPPNGSETEYDREDYRWVNSITLAPGTQLDAGGDYRREDGRSIGYVEFFGDRTPTDFSLQRDTGALFASIASRPQEWLLLNASVRRDFPEGFDDETTYRAGVRMQVVQPLVLSFNWGEAYKLPSFFALGNALVGNPDLQPELAESWDAGVSWAPARNVSLDLTWFSNRFTDLVDFDDETFRNVNRREVDTQGLELAAAWQPGEHLGLRAHATYTDIDVADDTVLTGRPDWSAGLVGDWQMTARWATSLDYRYTGEQWSISRHTGQEERRRLADYHRLDWVLTLQGAKHWQVQLSVDNLLDEDYVTAIGFSAPGRLARLGVTVTL